MTDYGDRALILGAARRSLARRVGTTLLALAVVTLVAATFGIGSKTPSSAAVTKAEPLRGGTLFLVGTGDVDFMDPNVAYYNPTYLVLRAWSRQLYSYPATPGETTDVVPDLATA